MESMTVMKALWVLMRLFGSQKNENSRKSHALTLAPPHIHLLKQHNHRVLANRLWWLSLWLVSELLR